MAEVSRKVLPTVLLMLLFTVIVVIFLVPLALLFVSSLRPGSDLMRYGLNFSIDWANANLHNYRLLFCGQNAYFNWYVNSLIVTAIQVVLALFLSSCVGYSFAMYDYKGKGIAFTCVLLVMMVPTEVIILPLYRMITKMGFVDNFLGIILPYIVIPMLIFFFRQYLVGIPRDFLDAARVDGYSEYGIFLKIMIPLMKPSFAAMGIYEGMQSWNNFLWPLLVFRSDANFTRPIGLSTLLTPYGNNYDLLIVGAFFSVIPLFVLFVAFQRYFLDGMTAGAVKG